MYTPRTNARQYSPGSATRMEQRPRPASWHRKWAECLEHDADLPGLSADLRAEYLERAAKHRAALAAAKE